MQMENNFWSKIDYKEIRYDLHINLVQLRSLYAIILKSLFKQGISQIGLT